ncbi:hypothetical protein BH11PAT3_BH11PAT3_2090 [soil metagenome]
MIKSPSFVFFGTSDFSVYVLDSLLLNNFVPQAIVTFPNKPEGRHHVLTPNPVKRWAQVHNVKIIESLTFKTPEFEEIIKKENADVFVVASFGKILPDNVIYMPQYKTLNVHPSLLPKLRGPSPIQGAMLLENETGVSIMRLSSKMDEGPILLHQKVEFETWPLGYTETEKILGKVGGELLAEVFNKLNTEPLPEIDQDHSKATYTHMIQKSEGDITNDTPQTALRKIKAFKKWPRTRIGDLIVTDAHIEEEKLVIDKVIPPGKKEMLYKDYLRNK